MDKTEFPQLLNRIERKIKPEVSYQCSNAIIRLYKAKDILKKKWNDPDLRKLTLYCRKAYHRYGKRPLLDRYDVKAGIYLASASYQVLRPDNSVCLVREWLSIRLVPGNGQPLGGGELEIYKFKGKRLDLVIRDKIFNGDRNFWRKIVSSSRMCGINPYPADNNGINEDQILPKRHVYLAECFALIQWQFIQDGDMFYDYITEIIPNKLANKALVVRCNGLELKPGSRPAHELINLPRKDIRLNRKIYSYKFPVYWLNMKQLSKLLKYLLRKGYLSERTFRYYLKTDLSLHEVIDGRKLGMSRLGELLIVKGSIQWSKIYGSELRKLVDKYVKDEPELKITGIQIWTKAISSIVKVLNAKVI